MVGAAEIDPAIIECGLQIRGEPVRFTASCSSAIAASVSLLPNAVLDRPIVIHGE